MLSQTDFRWPTVGNQEPGDTSSCNQVNTFTTCRTLFSAPRSCIWVSGSPAQLEAHLKQVICYCFVITCYSLYIASSPELSCGPVSQRVRRSCHWHSVFCCLNMSAELPLSLLFHATLPSICWTCVVLCVGSLTCPEGLCSSMWVILGYLKYLKVSWTQDRKVWFFLVLFLLPNVFSTFRIRSLNL